MSAAEKIGLLGFGIAVLGFSLAAFNTYWTHFRVRRSFYFLRVADFMTGTMPEFALVNGGSRDELILSVRCIFEHNAKGEATYPLQDIKIDPDNVRLLEAGKAYRCTVAFLQPFGSEFAKLGRKEAQMGGYYIFQMVVQIEWADMDGKVHRKSVRHSDVGFDENGIVRLIKPLAQRADLYEKSPLLKARPIEVPLTS